MRSNGKAILALQDVSSSGRLEIAVASNPFTVKASVHDGTVQVVLTEEATNVFLSNGKSKLAASGSYRGCARVKVNGRVLRAPPSVVGVDTPFDYRMAGDYGMTGIFQAEDVAARLRDAYLRANRQPLPEGVPILDMVIGVLQTAAAAYRI